MADSGWPPILELGQVWWLGPHREEYRLTEVLDDGSVLGVSVRDSRYRVSASPAKWVDTARAGRAGLVEGWAGGR